MENSEYDREIAEDRVHYSGQEQGNIMGADGVKEGLVDSLGNSLENSLESLDQHTDVLIEEEIVEKHTEMLAEEEKALRPYEFCINNFLVNVGVVDDGENLTPLDSQRKEEENFVEDFNPWNEENGLLDIMLNK